VIGSGSSGCSDEVGAAAGWMEEGVEAGVMATAEAEGTASTTIGGSSIPTKREGQHTKEGKQVITPTTL